MKLMKSVNNSVNNFGMYIKHVNTEDMEIL